MQHQIQVHNSHRCIGFLQSITQLSTSFEFVTDYPTLCSQSKLFIASSETFNQSLADKSPDQLNTFQHQSPTYAIFFHTIYMHITHLTNQNKAPMPSQSRMQHCSISSSQLSQMYQLSSSNYIIWNHHLSLTILQCSQSKLFTASSETSNQSLADKSPDHKPLPTSITDISQILHTLSDCILSMHSQSRIPRKLSANQERSS